MIAAGEQYAVLALHTLVPHPREQFPHRIGDQLWATASFPVRLTDHWKEWLGSVHVTALGHCNLFFLATLPSAQPGVLDGENQQLSDVVDRLYQMLLFTGAIRLFERPGRLTGAHSSDDIGIRQVSEIPPPCWFPGMPAAM
jgi:hypothetical protein